MQTAVELAATICTPKQVRLNVKAVIGHMEECHVRCIPLSAELAAAIPLAIAQLINSDSPKVKNAGAKLAIAALKHNLEVVNSADKIARLDAGEPTEITEQKPSGMDDSAFRSALRRNLGTVESEWGVVPGKS